MNEKLKSIFEIYFQNCNSPLDDIINNMIEVVINLQSIKNTIILCQIFKLKNLFVEKIKKYTQNNKQSLNIKDNEPIKVK